MKQTTIINGRVSIALILGMIFCVLTAVPVAASNIVRDDAEIVSDRQIPFNQSAYIVNGDSSEFVNFTGSIHLVVKYVLPPNPILPPNPVRVHTNLLKVTGTGQTSGLTYQLNGASEID